MNARMCEPILAAASYQPSKHTIELVLVTNCPYLPRAACSTHFAHQRPANSWALTASPTRSTRSAPATHQQQDVALGCKKLLVHSLAHPRVRPSRLAFTSTLCGRCTGPRPTRRLTQILKVCRREDGVHCAIKQRVSCALLWKLEKNQARACTVCMQWDRCVTLQCELPQRQAAEPPATFALPQGGSSHRAGGCRKVLQPIIILHRSEWRAVLAQQAH